VKKLSAILLICIFLFNLFGYRLVVNYLLQQGNVHLEAALDKNDFNEAELITIQIPLSLPYQNNQENFERVDGELKLDGKIYKYVKRKISDGKLILLCLPDHKKMQLQSARDEFFKNTTDLVQNNSNKKSGNTKYHSFRNAMGEYDNFLNTFKSLSITQSAAHSLFTPVYYYPSSPHISPDQPPELL
jgi:hypothetical protein